MERRKFVVGLGALAAGSSAAIGTGAFTAAEISGREANINVVGDTDGLIGLRAGDSDLVTDDGGAGENELSIDFDPNGEGRGVNPNSVYQVGGFGRFDESNLENLPGDPTVAPPVSAVAIDTSSDDYAFAVMNQATEAKSVEITYEANEEPFPDGINLYMVGIYEGASSTPTGESGLVVGDAANQSDKSASILLTDQEGDQYTEQLGAGDEVKVTLLVDVDDVAAEEYDDDGEVDLGGQIIVRAGEHDGLTVIEE